MHVLYNCKGEAVAKYCTTLGLKIGIGKRLNALWTMYYEIPACERKQYDMIYYTEYKA